MKPLFSLVRSIVTASVIALVLAACSGGGQSVPLAQLASNGQHMSDSSTALHSAHLFGTARNAVASVATFKGCPVFAAGDAYNLDISNAAVDPNSSSYLASIESLDNTGFSAALGLEPVNVDSGGASLLAVHPEVSYHPFPAPYPWTSGYQIENESDRHYVAVNTQSCHLYEAYGMSYSNGSLQAFSGRDFDMRQPYKMGIGVTAAGLSYFAGAARHEEVATGIHHALDLDVWRNALCNCSTPPGAESDGIPYEGRATNYSLPYGAHLRLKSSYNCSGWGEQSAAICNALKHYGAYITDTDGQYTNNNKIFVVDPPTDGGSWNRSDLAALNMLKFSDFDVLRITSITAH